MRLGIWVLPKLFERDRHSLFELRIVSFGYSLGILIDDDVRVDAMVLHIPFALGREEGDGG